jgi:hypothetical protein
MLPVIAQADVFSFNYNGAGVNASGLITADKTVTPGEWLITGITGYRNGDPITFIPIPDPGQFLVDNLLFVPPDPGYFDGTDHSGFVIQTADGLFDPYYINATGHFESQIPGNFNPGVPITFTASAVPEPTSILFLGTVVLGLAGALKRKWA